MKNAKIETDKAYEKRIKKVQPSVVELVSYSIKAVIPTGSYANIQPEIIVKANNLKEAEDYVIPHITKMFYDFGKMSVGSQVTYSVSQSPVSEMKKAMEIPTVMTTSSAIPEMTETPGTIAVTTAFLKAEQAVGSCLSSEALQLIESQISKSVKLNHEEKFALLKLVSLKADELNK